MLLATIQAIQHQLQSHPELGMCNQCVEKGGGTSPRCCVQSVCMKSFACNLRFLVAAAHRDGHSTSTIPITIFTSTKTSAFCQQDFLRMLRAFQLPATSLYAKQGKLRISHWRYKLAEATRLRCLWWVFIPGPGKDNVVSSSSASTACCGNEKEAIWQNRS